VVSGSATSVADGSGALCAPEHAVSTTPTTTTETYLLIPTMSVGTVPA
jgi:hypothetical protein